MKLQFRLLMLAFDGVRWLMGPKQQHLPSSSGERSQHRRDQGEVFVARQKGRISFGRLGWTDPVIFSKVIIPWELRLLEQSGWKPLTP